MENVDIWASLFVALGGGLGAVLRYLLDARLKNKGWSPVKSVTTINVLGTVFLALTSLMVMFVSVGTNPFMTILAVSTCTAIAGGFTTFSTAMVEAVRSPKSNGTEFGTLCLSLFLCLVLYAAFLIGGYLFYVMAASAVL